MAQNACVAWRHVTSQLHYWRRVKKILYVHKIDEQAFYHWQLRCLYQTVILALRGLYFELVHERFYVEFLLSDVGKSERRGVTPYHSPFRVASLLRGFWARFDPEHTSPCARNEERGDGSHCSGGGCTIKKDKKSAKIMRHHPLSRHFVCVCVCVCGSL